MPKAESLYKALNNLEIELFKIIKNELILISNEGNGNFYITCNTSYSRLFTTKDPNTKNIDNAVSLENKIISLRTKLRLLDEYSLLDLIKDFCTEIEEGRLQWVKERSVAKKYLKHEIMTDFNLKTK